MATTAVSMCGRSSSCHVTFTITIMCTVKVSAADPNLISDPTNHSNPNPTNPNGERHLRFYRSYYLEENYNNQVWSERWWWRYYKLLWNRAEGGYIEVDECDSTSRIWRERERGDMKIGPKRARCSCGINVIKVHKLQAINNFVGCTRCVYPGETIRHPT